MASFAFIPLSRSSFVSFPIVSYNFRSFRRRIIMRDLCMILMFQNKILILSMLLCMCRNIRLGASKHEMHIERFWFDFLTFVRFYRFCTTQTFPTIFSNSIDQGSLFASIYAFSQKVLECSVISDDAISTRSF